MTSRDPGSSSLYARFGKRAFDIVFALVALPVLGVAAAVSGPAIKLEDGGPILFRGERRGRNGEHFTMYKFRSMVQNAPDLRNPDGSTLNGESDVRVTRVGRLLRKTSVDELPQFLNVLMGDMSVVGPRPNMAVKEWGQLSEAERKRLRVRPGITGPAQVSGRNRLPVQARREIDCEYVDHVTFRRDVQILGKTVLSVVRQDGVNG